MIRKSRQIWKNSTSCVENSSNGLLLLTFCACVLICTRRKKVNALSKDFSTVGELLASNKSNVYVRPQIGAKSISILVECLGELGYKLKD